MSSMRPRRLGSTSLQLSPIGFGAFKIGRTEGAKYAEAYSLPSDAEATALVHAVLDLGITLIDTAPAYGVSEERVGAYRRFFARCWALLVPGGRLGLETIAHDDAPDTAGPRGRGPLGA